MIFLQRRNTAKRMRKKIAKLSPEKREEVMKKIKEILELCKK